MTELKQRARKWLDGIAPHYAATLVADLLAALETAEARDVRESPLVRELVAAWDELNPRSLDLPWIRLRAAIDALRLPEAPKIPDTAKSNAIKCVKCGLPLRWGAILCESCGIYRNKPVNPPAPSDSERIAEPGEMARALTVSVLEMGERIAALEHKVSILEQWKRDHKSWHESAQLLLKVDGLQTTVAALDRALASIANAVLEVK